MKIYNTSNYAIELKLRGSHLLKIAKKLLELEKQKLLFDNNNCVTEPLLVKRGDYVLVKQENQGFKLRRRKRYHKNKQKTKNTPQQQS